MSVTTELKSLGHAILFRSGLSSVIARRHGCGRILMYHGVARQGAGELAAQLRYLATHFKVVSLETMLDRIMNGSYPLADEIVLTFDDGLRNNLTVVYPVLRELQLPATMFVCPALVESGEWLWNHEMRCRLQSLAAPDLAELRMKRQELNALRSPLERCGAIVSRWVDATSAHGHPQARELGRWDQVYQAHQAGGSDPVRALADLVVAGVRSAVIAPELELRRWFSWTWYWTDAMLDELVAQGRLRRAGHGQVAAGPGRP